MGHIEELVPEKYHNTILDFNIERWVNAISDVTPKTVFVPLALEDLAAFRSAYRKHCGEGEISPEAQQRLATITQELEKAMNAVRLHPSDPVFVKTSSRSAKDSTISLLRGDYQTFVNHHPDANNNDKIRHLLIAGFNALKVGSAAAAVAMLTRSERVDSDFHIATQQECLSRFQQNLVVRRWENIDPTTELRGFVVNGRLTALSQYCNLIHVPFLHDNKDQILFAVVSFFLEHCSRQLAKLYDRYVIDFGFSADMSRVVVIEVNPFLPTTDAALFCWAKDAALLKGDKLQETKQLEDSAEITAGMVADAAASVKFEVLLEPPRGALGNLLDEWRRLVQEVKPTEPPPATRGEEGAEEGAEGEEEERQGIAFESNALYAAWDAAMSWPPQEPLQGLLDYCNDDHCANYLPCAIHTL